MPDGRSSGSADRLLEQFWEQRSRRASRRELAAELTAAAAFLAAAITILAVLGDRGDWSTGRAAVLLVAFALVSRVEFPVGAGYVVPSQLVLVPMLFGLPPAAVPLLVAGGLVLGALGDRVLGRGPTERLLFSIPDAWHAVGPALVLALAGAPAPDPSDWPLYAAAFASACVADLGSATAREWLALGIAPRVQTQVVLIAWLVDLLLAPIGFLAALAAVDDPATALLALPLAALLALLARERSRRIAQAQMRLEQVRHERTRLQAAVRRIGEAFAAKLDLRAVLDITLHAFSEAVDASAGRATIPRRLAGDASEHIVVGALGPVEAALAEAERLALADGAPRSASQEGVSALAWPIGEVAGRQPAALLALARIGPEFREDELTLLEDLVEQVSAAAGTIARHEALHAQALTDGLTDLSNHRRFHEQLHDLFDRHRADATPLALVLLDIDDFKAINDAYGHQAGDTVLRAVAGALAASCRFGDEPARYGGEEFAVVLPSSDLEGALLVAERIREAIADLHITAESGDRIAVTASIGVAELNPQVRDAADLIALADEALYAAKRSGKNAVLWATGRAAA